MTRTAMARCLAVILVTLAALFLLANFSGRSLAQQPEGAGINQSAQTHPPANSQKPATSPLPDTPSKSTLAQFAWLAGRWEGAWGPRVAHQVWMKPQSGVMVGVFQLTEDGQTLVVELYTIIPTRRGIELRVRHFTPSLTPWEKSGPEVLKLKTIDLKSILFENAGIGQPKHWLMKRTDDGTYVTRFEIVPENGQAQTAEITYHRQHSAATPNHK